MEGASDTVLHMTLMTCCCAKEPDSAIPPSTMRHIVFQRSCIYYRSQFSRCAGELRCVTKVTDTLRTSCLPRSCLTMPRVLDLDM